MFYLLYYTESMNIKKSYCFNTSTNYFINQHMLNIKGLKSLPFKNNFNRPILRIKKLSHDVWCNNLPM